MKVRDQEASPQAVRMMRCVFQMKKITQDQCESKDADFSLFLLSLRPHMVWVLPPNCVEHLVPAIR